MFISPAYAQTGAPGGADFIGMLLPLVAIMGVFWFLLIRPQQKKMREHQQMVANLRRGDTVVTSGGLIGKITKVVDENEVMLEVSEGLRLKFLRSHVSELRVKGEPAKDETRKKPAK